MQRNQIAQLKTDPQARKLWQSCHFLPRHFQNTYHVHKKPSYLLTRLSFFKTWWMSCTSSVTPVNTLCQSWQYHYLSKMPTKVRPTYRFSIQTYSGQYSSKICITYAYASHIIYATHICIPPANNIFCKQRITTVNMKMVSQCDSIFMSSLNNSIYLSTKLSCI